MKYLKASVSQLMGIWHHLHIPTSEWRKFRINIWNTRKNVTHIFGFVLISTGYVPEKMTHFPCMHRNPFKCGHCTLWYLADVVCTLDLTNVVEITQMDTIYSNLGQ